MFARTPEIVTYSQVVQIGHFHFLWNPKRIKNPIIQVYASTKDNHTLVIEEKNRPLQLLQQWASESGGSQYYFLYIIVVGMVRMVVVNGREVGSDQMWNAWVWKIREHVIDTIKGRIHSDWKRSSPCCCDSLVSVQSAPAGLCPVHY